MGIKSYAQSVDPESKDYLLWRKEGQPLVDAAYIAESFLRGYDALWVPLDDLTKQVILLNSSNCVGWIHPIRIGYYSLQLLSAS